MTVNPRILDKLPEEVDLVDPVWIPMSDGCRLAARLWLPRSAKSRPVPAILEYIPYRRRDGSVIGDTPRHGYYAGHGYACLRVDMRGSGDSDGVLVDEYLKQEHDDAVEAIAWIAAQPWCSGKVGMMGISWGGFNALQVAARRPPALKAIITVCSTDDRYADDCHYMGGALLLNNLSWASTMLAYNARPPDPAIVGARWREMWLERLAGSPPFLAEWIRHQLRDEFWRHGSVCEDYGAIEAATYAVGGWADGYSNAIPRLLAGLKAPAKGLIGPWAHEYPHMARPGPQIGFLQDSLRWWDHWLKDKDTGMMAEPQLTAWLQDWAPPASDYEERPGRWVRETSWPPQRPMMRLHLDDGRLGDRPASAAAPLRHRSPQVTGITWGEWCPYGYHGELPTDQRPDDGRSLCFDSAPLKEPLDLLGAPVAHLKLAIDRPRGSICARLSEVAPDGAATLLSYGILNLTHRMGHHQALPMRPGEPVTVALRLNDIGQRISAGHRLRLAISTSYWPMIWPAPEPFTLSLHAQDCALDLPARPPRPEDQIQPAFGEPEMAAPANMTRARLGRRNREVHEDPTTGETVMTIHRERGAYRLHDIDLEVDAGAVERFSIVEGDPLSARGEITWQYRMTRGDWDIRSESRTVLTSSATMFHLRAELDAFEGEQRVFSRNWSFDIPRDGL
jgi:hypothetical protein